MDITEVAVGLGAVVLGAVLMRTLFGHLADKGQRDLEIKVAVNDEKEKNLREKQKEIQTEANVEVEKLEKEKERNLNVEELADWFNSRNKSDK